MGSLILARRAEMQRLGYGVEFTGRANVSILYAVHVNAGKIKCL